MVEPSGISVRPAPFVVALVAAELLLRLRLSGLAVIAGFCATVYLVADFTFFSCSPQCEKSF